VSSGCLVRLVLTSEHSVFISVCCSELEVTCRNFAVSDLES